jgi:hypothetical protein
MPFEKDEQQPLTALIGRAQALIDVGKWREALKPLRQALVIEPENGEVHRRTSFAWLQLGDFEFDFRRLPSTAGDMVDPVIQFPAIHFSAQPDVQAAFAGRAKCYSRGKPPGKRLLCRRPGARSERGRPYVVDRNLDSQSIRP